MRLPTPDEANPNAGIRVRRRRRLQVVAATQGGCFTIEQAAEAGYDRKGRHHHLSYGNWVRTAAPRVHRLAGWPQRPDEDLHVWLLWAGRGAALTAWTALTLRLGADAPAEFPDDVPSTAPETPRTASPVDRSPTGRNAAARIAVVPDPAPPPTGGAGDESPGATRADPTLAHIVRHVRRSGPGAVRDVRPVRSGPVVLHSVWARRRPAEMVGDLPVRPLEEALAVALQHADDHQIDQLLPLIDELLVDGSIDLWDGIEVAQSMNCGRMRDLLWSRVRPLRSA